MKRIRRNCRGLISPHFCGAWQNYHNETGRGRGLRNMAAVRHRALGSPGTGRHNDSQACFARRPPARPDDRRLCPARRAARAAQAGAAGFVRGPGPLPGARPRRRRGCNVSTRPRRRSIRRRSGATSSSSTAARSARAGAVCSASLCRGCRSSAAATTAARTPRRSPSSKAPSLRASQDGYGHWVVRLQDESLWVQIDNNALALRPRPGQPVLIRRAALGSYVMRVNGQPGIRVRRQL